MKNIPEWDIKKSYYEQKREVFQFWEEEFNKIKFGVNIGGYHMHGWTYFHINYFKTPIPTKTNLGTIEDIVKTPELDDNFLIFAESYAEAEKTNNGLFLFGTRGSLKSTALSSNAHWTSLVKNNGVITITGGDAGDLGDLTRLMLLSMDEIHPAFRVDVLKRDIEKEILLGIRQKDQTPIEKAKIKITNAEAGNKNKSEKGAGGSPIGYIIDEAGKFAFEGIFKAAKPAFETPYGYRLVPILAGTSGNDKLSSDAKKVLSNPKAYNMLTMNYDRLERGIREEDITWKDTKKKNFSVFMPGQMSYRLIGVPKKTKTLSELLGIDEENLKKIPIKCTDWQGMNQLLKQRLADCIDEEAKDKERMYYPRDLDDVFLVKGRNPFPVKACQRRLNELKESGNTGRSVELMPMGTTFDLEFSTKDLAPTYYTGGVEDAPIVIYGEFPKERPKKYINLAGLDHYKLQGPASEGSLGVFYVLKRRNLDINNPCETILASYAARPSTHKEFNYNGEKLLKAFNAECNMEAADTSFQQHLSDRHIDQDYLCPAFSFSKAAQSGKNVVLTTMYGLYPTTGNNETRMNYLFEWAKESHVVGIADDGTEISKLSVEFIDDPYLLQEMIDFKDGGNFDRISAFSHALILCREHDKNNVRPVEENKKRNELHRHVKAKRKMGAFSTRLPKR